MFKFLSVIMLAAMLAGCGWTIKKEPPVVVVMKDCMGDLDKDGTISIVESQAVTIAKFSTEQPTFQIGDVKYTTADVVASADANKDGKLSDDEFTKVILNRSYGCKYAK